MSLKRLSAGFALFATSLPLLAATDPAATEFVVEDIRVDGLQRISAGTVFSYLPVRLGESLDDQRLREALRALFRTGFFRDVEFARDGNVLVISVDERPAIARINIEGNEDIETEPLIESLKGIGLGEGRVFDRSTLERVEQELQQQYFAQGKYAVQIETRVTPLERNRVGVDIDIKEGETARIKEINIIGNRAFDDEDLLGEFQLTGPRFWAFWSGTDQYSKQKLSADLEALRAWYLDRGYIEFDITSTQVSISPDRESIYITINIDEGRPYRLREVRLAGDLVVGPDELFPRIDVQRGDTFSRKEIQRVVEALAQRLSESGYAFANINSIPKIDDQTDEVDLTFFVDPGKRVYVRRITMAGNTRTEDEVLRRESRQMESSWFSSEAVERTRTRIERLGYFEEVNVETPPVPGSDDQVDIEYSVVERPSGNLLFGVGFAQTSGFLINASISEQNFLGSGKQVSATFNNSDINTVYSFNYANPYYTLDGVSRGFGAYVRETDAAAANLANYTTDAMGGNVSWGLPVSEFDRIRFGLEAENLQVNATTLTPVEITNFLADKGDTFNALKVNASWTHDTRNRTIFADRGTLQSVSLEATVPGSDLTYFKLNLRELFYIPLTRHFTLSLNGELGYGEGYGDNADLPFYENFYAGGVRSIRGFDDNTLGPRDSNLNPLGGALRVVGNIELLFPPPFFTQTNSFRMSTFVDVGNVFATTGDFAAEDLRYSVGVGATWLSPLGALSFSLAKPINDEPGDELQLFQFTIGTPF